MASLLGEELRKVVLAGIGATAMTMEKSRELVDELVEKGEFTVEQGKSMNEELKHNIKKTFNFDKESNKFEDLDKMSAEDLEALKAKLTEMDKAKTVVKDEKK